MAETQGMDVQLSEEIVAVLGSMGVQSGTLSITEELKRSIELRKFLSDRVEAGDTISLRNRQDQTEVTVAYP